MDLQILRFFVTAAQAKSFSAAADKLLYAQSNLSSRIKQLEEELGVTLFYRYKKGVSLTASGEVLYDYALKILNLADEAVIAVKNDDKARGKLSLGSIEATASQDLPKLLYDYHMKYPNVKLSVKTELNDVFRELVRSYELDGAFIAGPVDAPELSQIPFKTEEMALAAGGNWEDAPADEILRDAPLITFPEGSVFRYKLEQILWSKGFSYLDRLTVINSLGTMTANICAGTGCGFLPRSIIAPFLKQGMMKEFRVDSEFAELNIVFIYRKDHVMDMAFRSFLDMIKIEGAQ